MKKLLSALLFLSVLIPLRAEPVIIRTQTLVSATTTSTSALAANLSRHYLLIVNNGTQTVYVKMGAAHVSTEGVPLLAGWNWEPIAPPVDAIYLKSASGTQSVSIVEGN